MVQMAPDRLTRFLALGENIMALAQETGEPIAVLLNWLEQPSIADTIARYHAAQNAARVQAALSTLHRIVSESSDPTEQRRAATTVLRTLAPPPASGPAPRASSLPRSSPQSRDPASPSSAMPQSPQPRCLPRPSTESSSSPAVTPIPPSSTPNSVFQNFQLATLELYRPTDTAEFAFDPALAVYLPLPDRFTRYPAHLSLGPDADFFHFASSLFRLPDSS